jgi:hypothetical protein
MEAAVINADEVEEITIIYGGVPVTFNPWDFWEAHIAAPKNCGFSYLVPADVVRIRTRYHRERVSVRELAQEYNLSKRAVYRIVGGYSYKNVPMPIRRTA